MFWNRAGWTRLNGSVPFACLLAHLLAHWQFRNRLCGIQRLFEPETGETH
jgi:hypothetical protein